MNAESATAGEFPWMASFQNKKTKKHFCSGTVINHNWIITAAHCFRSVMHKGSYILENGLINILTDLKSRFERRVMPGFFHIQFKFSEITKNSGYISG